MELLARMQQLCPTSVDNTKLFRNLFLQRLSQEVQIHLSVDYITSMVAPANQEDKLMALMPTPLNVQ